MVKPYILAYTLAMLLTKSDMLKPEVLLFSEHFSDNMLGAQAISVFVNIYLDEMLPEFKEYASDILLHLSENVIGRLELLARESRDFIYIKALSDILVADISLSRHAERALGSEAVSSVSDMIEASQDIFLSAWELSFEDEQDLLKGDMTATLVSTLGALPVSRKLADERINNVFCISFIRGQFMYLRRLWQIEGIGAALAMIYCYRERSNFLDIWETMVKELVDEGECTRRGENIYRQQSERLKELGWTREVPVNVF